MRVITWLPIFLVAASLVGCVSAKTSGPDTADALNRTDDTRGRSYTEALREQAHARYVAGDFQRAIEQLESYLILDSRAEDSWTRNLLYYSYMAVGRYRDALEIANQLVKERPYEGLSYQQVGLAQLWLGDAKHAVQNFQRTLEFESHSPQAAFYLGLAHERLRNNTKRDEAFRQAETECQEILRANPRDFKASYELASLYLYSQQNLDKVAPLLNSAREALASRATEEDVIAERHLYLAFYLPLQEGIYLYRSGEPREALRPLFNALVGVPHGIRADLAELYFFIGESYRALKEEGLSRSFYQKSLALDPTGIYAPTAQGAIRQLAGKGG